LDLPVQERAAALAAMTMAPAMRQRVGRLLAAQTDAGPLDLALPKAAWRAAPTDALSGRQLGRWLLQHEIGRGGMAVVYRAQSLAGPTGQIAAVKVLSLGAVARSGHERLFVEQQALLRLRHPFIASLYETGLADDDTPWLAMELVEGESIDAWCAKRALGDQDRGRLVLQVAEALAYAHRNLVIHRDIKPSNVMVDRDGHVRLLDFGTARLAAALRGRTGTATPALTPAYAAPQQLLGAPPSTSMDVHGLGALLRRLLETRSRGERRTRGDLDTILSKALAGQPESRYASVEAMADDLTRWLERRPIQAR